VVLSLATGVAETAAENPARGMERFSKMAMGFPMLATAVWLFTLAAPNFGENGDLWLGMFFGVARAGGVGLWGQFCCNVGPNEEGAGHGRQCCAVRDCVCLGFGRGT